MEGYSGDWNKLSNFIEEYRFKHYSIDFWNTIAFSNPKFKVERANYLSKQMGSMPCPNRINEVIKEIGINYNSLQESGSVIHSPDELYEQLAHCLKTEYLVSVEQIISQVDKIFLKYQPKLSLGFIDFLKTVGQEKITISITSNTAFVSGKIIKKYLEQEGIKNAFSFFLFSDEIGFAKPSTEMFKSLYENVVLSQTEIKKNEIFHVGDNYLTDVEGPRSSGITSFHLKNGFFCRKRYAPHIISNVTNIGFSPDDYSKFKFGDFSIAKKFGRELFDYFVREHFNEIDRNLDTVIIYSSPYTYIPTSSLLLTNVFTELLHELIKSSRDCHFELRSGKINRRQTYTDDYGAMTAEQRYDLIKHDTYEFEDLPGDNDLAIFLDDISVTGTHQRIIEEEIVRKNIISETIFLYYSKIESDEICPTFENTLNYSYVNSLERFCEVVISEDFRITSRNTKYILQLSKMQLNKLIDFLKFNKKSYILKELIDSAILNGYEEIDGFKLNLNQLKNEHYLF